MKYDENQQQKKSAIVSRGVETNLRHPRLFWSTGITVFGFATSVAFGLGSEKDSIIVN